MIDITYPCTADDSMQPARFYAPESENPAPLLVVLHTWSGNWRQDYHDDVLAKAAAKRWAVIHPDFRGPNNRPEACGSELVVPDIVDAVRYAKVNAHVDPARIYLFGTSGGGYAAMLTAGRAPGIWAGVSAWVGIVDLEAWYRECVARKSGYADDIVASCGGRPGDSPEVDEEYRKRSAKTHLVGAKGVKLDLNAGITDGHTGSVPISHSLRAFNPLADAKDRISEKDIAFMTERAEVPPHFVEPFDDPTYGEKRPLFRRESRNARITLFAGGHECIPEAALSWLERQRKEDA